MHLTGRPSCTSDNSSKIGSRASIPVPIGNLALAALSIFCLMSQPSRAVLAQDIASDKTVKIATSENVSGQQMEWLAFSPQIFERARRENKLVLLDLEAVWCHWCHVMAEETYKDADVIKLLKSKYLCVRVDQDSRPDLSNRYEQYGWPATIIFAGDGHELVKNAGYINPENMRRLLKETASQSKHGSKDSLLDAKQAQAPLLAQDQKFIGLLPDLKEGLIQKHKKGYDTKYGAWGSVQKFLDFDSAECAMALGQAGDKSEAAQAKASLDAELNLLDPAFGGLYQYSTDGDWLHPHYEKVMAIQADGIRLYSLGYQIYQDPAYLKAATVITRYLNDFLLSPDGAYYTSQDADLEPGVHSGDYFALDRRARQLRGVPRVDQHIYSRENGQVACALTYLYRVNGEAKYLEQAIKAVNWIEAHRAITGSPGRFRHDEVDQAGPFLGDTLAMGRAYLALYEVTSDRSWLDKAKNSCDFIARHFQIDGQPGFVSSAASDVDAQRLSALSPQPLLDENVNFGRFANLLFQYTGVPAYHEQSLRALAYLSRPEIVAQRRIFVGGILLLDGENQHPPLHVTVSGAKADPAARALFVEAIKLPNLYKRVDWWDASLGPQSNSDTELPTLPQAAAFCCGEGRCSRPAYTPNDLKLMVTRLTGASTKQSQEIFDQSYAGYGRELAKYVEGDSGLVHYRLWQKDQSGLDDFLNSVAQLKQSIYDHFTRDQQLAFWLNVYNALAIKSVLDHYPIKANVDYFPPSSIRQFNDGWEVLHFQVLGHSTTLYEIEHERLRLVFKDPRVHFAVGSASRDSAPISAQPYVSEGLDERLEELAHKFFQKPGAYSLDAAKNQVAVSRIFNWFTLDFAAKAGHAKVIFPPPEDKDIVLSYIALYLPDKQRVALESARKKSDFAFDYLPYDWTLNDAD